jgi:hypothetical protein
MFVYCVRVLHFSEAAAYKRIRAARATRRHPELLAALRRGDLHVTAVSLLAAQLSDESCGEWIQAARHKTADEIKQLLADRQPKPDVADCVRRVPVPKRSGNAAAATVSEREEIAARKTHPGRDTAGGSAPGRRALPLRLSRWRAVRCGGVPRVPPHRPLGPKRNAFGGRNRAAVPRTQPIRGSPGLRRGAHGAVSQARGDEVRDPGGEGEPCPETRVLAQRELGSARQERLV